MFNKKLLIFVFLNIFLIQKIFWFFVIYEVFPNTIDDKILEYISIKYNWELEKSLSWHTLEDSTKVYNFWDEIFQKDEIKQYFRTQTSIILNNTWKEIYLKDSEWNIVDTFIYWNTQKWIIYRKDLDWNLLEIISEDEIVEDEIIEEEITSPQPSPLGEGVEGWNINNEIGEEEIIEENLVEEIVEENEIILEIETEIINISVKNIFQSPTYLNEKDFDFWNKQAVYNCDRTRDDCRVNLDFRPTFVWDLKENQFNCFVDFWFWNTTWEENKCNPNTVIVPLWSYTFDIKITHKINQNISWNLKMRIINDGKLIIPKPETQIVYQNVSSLNKSTQTINNSISNNNVLDFPKPVIKIQSWLDKNNTCNKKECSVNLIYEIPNKNLDCSWDFWDGIFRVWDDTKCNPIAVKYNSWKHIIKLEVCEKWNDTNCRNEVLEFENLYKKQEVKSVITLQWRLTKNKVLDSENKIICKDSKSCSINLTWWKSTWEKLEYFWDFWNWEYFDWRNPSSKIFEEWNYEIRLEVTDLDWDFDETFFYIDVFDKIQNIIEKENNLDNFLSFSDEKNNLELENKAPTVLKMELQWKIWQNKILEWNNLVCIKTCSVNFTWTNSSWNIVSYFWDFWNWETFSGSNPPHISYKNYWKYSVLFSVEDIYWDVTEKEFFIEFVEKLEKQNNQNLKLIESENEQKIYEIISDSLDETILENDILIEKDKSTNLHIYIIIFIICLFLLFWFILLKKYELIK